MSTPEREITMEEVIAKGDLVIAENTIKMLLRENEMWQNRYKAALEEIELLRDEIVSLT